MAEYFFINIAPLTSPSAAINEAQFKVRKVSSPSFTPFAPRKRLMRVIFHDSERRSRRWQKLEVA